MGLLNLEPGKENISPDKSEQTTFKLELQTQQEVRNMVRQYNAVMFWV